jgi:hypothetical protein
MDEMDDMDKEWTRAKKYLATLFFAHVHFVHSFVHIVHFVHPLLRVLFLGVGCQKKEQNE